ncbi:MAG: hypothetical protein IJV04_08130 [Lachnospiraceae bacterium]|nr:hypothetical protein [Lachnospiraceae bacterium]
MFKKSNCHYQRPAAILLIAAMLLSLLPPAQACAEDTYYTFYADGNEDSLFLPIPTGERPYPGTVHSWGYHVGPYICNLIINYNGYYGDIADGLFYDEGTDCQIVGTEHLENFFIELHPSSYINAADYDNIRLTVNGQKYQFDSQGRVSLAQVPRDLVYSLGVVLKKKEQKLEILSPKKTVVYEEDEVAATSHSFRIKAKAKSPLFYQVYGYPIWEASQFISVSKKGKVTLKKNAVGGLYTIRVVALENDDYYQKEQLIKIKVKGAKG